MIKPLPEVIGEIEKLYAFAKERHMIYKRRAKGKKFPWTEDKILREHKFTNIYRELDRGTLYYKDHVVKGIKNDEEIVFNTIAYRLLNLPESWHALSYDLLYDSLSSAKLIEKHMDELIKLNGKVFNGAYMILGNIPKGSKKTRYYSEYIHRLKELTPKLTKALKSALNAEQAFNIILEQENIGKFMAYEIYSDLLYTKVLPYSEDEFVNIGHGALPTLHKIFGKECKLSLRKQARIVQVSQKDWLPKKWKRLSLRNIEHTLCEYRKYVKILNGGSHTKYRNNDK